MKHAIESAYVRGKRDGFTYCQDFGICFSPRSYDGEYINVGAEYLRGWIDGASAWQRDEEIAYGGHYHE